MPDAGTELIERFYEAFGRHDGEAMAACYRADAKFHDPAFGDLHGAQIGAMWRMLTARAEDLEVELRERRSEGSTGSAHWIARYTFTQTGRPVVNDVWASFVFADGLFSHHVDDFSFSRWARQALGPMGWAITLFPPLGGAVRRRARQGLAEFVVAEGGGAAEAPG